VKFCNFAENYIQLVFIDVNVAADCRRQLWFSLSVFTEKQKYKKTKTFQNENISYDRTIAFCFLVIRLGDTGG